MTQRPTLDDLQAEQEAFIGPPAPPQIPKLTPASEREAVYKTMLDDLMSHMAQDGCRVMEE